MPGTSVLPERYISVRWTSIEEDYQTMAVTGRRSFTSPFADLDEVMSCGLRKFHFSEIGR